MRLEEQRQVVLDAGRREAVADVPIDGAAARVALEALAIALAKRLDRVGIERELARGQQRDALEPLAERCVSGSKVRMRLDLVVEEVDAKRVPAPIGNTSISEPRTANSPGLMTWATCA